MSTNSHFSYKRPQRWAVLGNEKMTIKMVIQRKGISMVKAIESLKGDIYTNKLSSSMDTFVVIISMDLP